MKHVSIPDIGEVQLLKHPLAKSLRISLGTNGNVKITVPKWLPYQAGIIFAQSKKEWILANRSQFSYIDHGQAIGKFHHIYFKASSESPTVSTRQKGSQLWVIHPHKMLSTDISAQTAAQRIAKRALKNQAETLLVQRVADLADKHDFQYKSVSVRHLKSRWGSCNSNQEITLNYFLMELPWDLIDYVLLHELSHTKALHHGPEFWNIFDNALPGAKKLRTRLKDYAPHL